MKIHCEQCGTVYNLNEDKIAAEGTPVKCKVCGHVFVAHRPSKSAYTEQKNEEEQSVETTEQPPAPQKEDEVFIKEEYEQFANIQAIPSPESETSERDFNVEGLHPAENWLKFVLGFAISIAIIALGYYFYDYTKQALNVWEKVDMQLTSTEDLERKIERSLTAQSPWDFYYDGLVAYNLSTEADYLKAKSLFENALTLNENMAVAHSALAETLIQIGIGLADGQALEDGAKHAKTAIELDPGLPGPLRALGNKALAAGDISEAQEYVDKAVLLDPNDGFTHLLQGQVFLKNKQPELAVESLKLARSNNPLLLQANFLLAQLYATKRDWDLAIRYAKAAVQINPAHPDAVRYLQMYNEQAEYAKHPEIVRRETAELGPAPPPIQNPIDQVDSFESLMWSGRSLKGKGALWEAVGKFRKAVELKPDHCEARTALGFTYYDLNQPKASMNEFQIALKSSNSCPQAYLGMAAIQQDDDNKEEAIQNYETYLRLSPSGKDSAEVRAILENLRRSP